MNSVNEIVSFALHSFQLNHFFLNICVLIELFTGWRTIHQISLFHDNQESWAMPMNHNI